MSSAAIIDLLQLIMVTTTTVVVMLVIAFRRDHGLINALTQTGLLLALLIPQLIPQILPFQVTPLLIFDDFSALFSSIMLIIAMVIVSMAYPYFEKKHNHNEEFYLLLLTATLGSLVMAGSNHFVSMFIGMEMLGVSLYAMIAYPVHSASIPVRPMEAAFKYLIMSGMASAFMLFGIALMYASSGSLEFSALAQSVSSRATEDLDSIMLVGLLLLFSGIAFKLSLVPFHIWTPDVYEGAPVPVTAVLATMSKAAMVAVALRLLLSAQLSSIGELVTALTVMAIASMLLGNFLALLQTNVKRLLAYSSVAHLGYLLVIIIAAAQIPDLLSVEGAVFYIAAYVFTSLAGFVVVNVLSDASRELVELEDYRGLFWRNPILAAVFIIVLLSLAGIPLTAGFIGKFYIFVTGVEGELWTLLTVLIAGSSVALYYYLRFIYVMLQSTATVADDPALRAIPTGSKLVMAVMVAFIIVLGIYPSPFITSIQQLAASF
jgi:NADH-quinone oxidoreductase subunit N